jgi:hypothetical protein
MCIGDMSAYQRATHQPDSFNIRSNLRKNPSPLNIKKRFGAVKQLSLGQVSIMWCPLQKNSIAVCPKFYFIR